MQTPSLSLYLLQEQDGVHESSQSRHYTPSGFPSPAADYLEERLSLNRILISNPTATYLALVQGNHLGALGLEENDLLLIDRSVPPRSGNMVLVWEQNEFTVKVLLKTKNRIFLQSSKHAPASRTPVSPESDCPIWGVITRFIRSV